MALTEYKTNLYHFWHDENGRYHGEYKEWWHNGQLYEQSYFVNDVRHGEFKRFYQNGRPADHGFYHNGIRHGQFKEWDDSGLVIFNQVYQYGIKLLISPSTLTDKDKFLLTLSKGIQWLPY